MDEPGFRARRRAERDDYDASYKGIEEPHPLNQQHIEPPEPSGATGYAEPNYRPPETQVAGENIPGATDENPEGVQGTFTHAGPHKDDPEAHRTGLRPHLQVMCGPMLRYDTVVNNVWHGFCLLVSADPGSVYDPKPILRWSTQPYAGGVDGVTSAVEGVQLDGGNSNQFVEVHAEKIYEFHALHGGNSFWRFKFEIPMQAHEQVIHYNINSSLHNKFHIAAAHNNFRWVGHSCNGFSSGVKVEDFNGPSPLWDDLLVRHQEQPIHVLIGGGDQIYCDPIAREPELHEWLTSQDMDWKAKQPLTPEMRFAMHRFFFSHYAAWYRNGGFAKAIASIPQVNMLDDHDLIDGFGTYPDKLMMSPVFNAIGSIGYFWYLLFQMHFVDEHDGTKTEGNTNKSILFGPKGPYLPFQAHHFLTYLGPNTYMCLLDCRCERKVDQICSQESYDIIFKALRALPSTVHQVILLLGVPIAYPRMVLAESIMESRWMPTSLLQKTGSGLTNRFNGQMELLDDLRDHWCATPHKPERNKFVLECARLAKERSYRITYLSGDVHAGGVSELFTKGNKVKPEDDPAYMLNVISSAIVNTPPPPGMITMLNKLASKTHKTLRKDHIDERMMELFKEDTDGSKLKNTRIMGRRNYCIVDYQEDGALRFDMRMEVSQGEGTTKGYSAFAPAVKY